MSFSISSQNTKHLELNLMKNEQKHPQNDKLLLENI